MLLATGHTNDEAKEKALIELRLWIQSGRGNKGCVDRYSNSEYEEIMFTLDFSGPSKMAEAAASILKDFKSAKILDAGAGSGLSGVELRKLGYTNIDAVDASSRLLELAKKKNVYNKITCQFLGSEPLPIEDGTYDMVTLSGAVGENHIPAEAFDDLIRVVKPGGHLINVFREAAGRAPYYGDGIETYFEKLEKMGKWRRLDRVTFPNFMTDMDGVALIYQII